MLGLFRLVSLPRFKVNGFKANHLRSAFQSFGVAFAYRTFLSAPNCVLLLCSSGLQVVNC